MSKQMEKLKEVKKSKRVQWPTEANLYQESTVHPSTPGRFVFEDLNKFLHNYFGSRVIHFMKKLSFPIDCLYADPDQKAYDVLVLYYGFGRTVFNPESAKVFSRFEALRNFIKNYTIEATPDDESGTTKKRTFSEERFSR